MTLEACCLLAAVFIGLVHIGGQSFALKLSVGNRWTVGARDERVEQGVMAGRWERASRNFQETFPLFAAVSLLALLLETSNTWTHWGALLYVTGRAAYLPAYLSGIPWFRTICWKFATLGIVLVGVGIVMAS